MTLSIEKRLFLLLFIIMMLALVAPGKQALACGVETNCTLDNGRYYRIKMPENHDGKTPVGAIIYAHGYKGTAAGAMRNKALTKAISDLGLAFIAVKSAGDDWKLANAPSQPTKEEQTEPAYFDAVIADAAQRFMIDKSQLMMTGFSAGGMMTWTLACERSENFIGFAPVAGTFWAPLPEKCTTPAANIIHFHGSSDRVVPLNGRPIGPTHQGSIYQAAIMYADHGDFDRETTQSNPLDLTCTKTMNAELKVLKICLHEGGHAFKTSYVVHAWNAFQNYQKSTRAE